MALGMLRPLPQPIRITGTISASGVTKPNQAVAIIATAPTVRMPWPIGISRMGPPEKKH